MLDALYHIVVIGIMYLYLEFLGIDSVHVKNNLNENGFHCCNAIQWCALKRCVGGVYEHIVSTHGSPKLQCTKYLPICVS